ncbi:MAG: hypothetical protein ACI3X4_00785 [Bacteroidaceae bacterium]
MRCSEAAQQARENGDAVIRLQIATDEDGERAVLMEVTDYLTQPTKRMVVPLSKQQANDLAVKLLILKKQL